MSGSASCCATAGSILPKSVMLRLSSFSKYLRIVRSSSARSPAGAMKPIVVDALARRGRPCASSGPAGCRTCRRRGSSRQLGRRAEIEHDDPDLAVGPALHEEVSGVRIGVEEPIDEQLLVEHLDRASSRRRTGRARASSSASFFVILTPSMNVIVITVSLLHCGIDLREQHVGVALEVLRHPRRSSRASFARSVSRASMSASCSCTRSICCTGTKLR